MASKIFLDTDVLLDFFMDREPFATAAGEIFYLMETGELSLYISALSINNIYYLASKQLGHDKSINIIEALTELTEIIGTTKSEILKALKNNFKDFEDSIQYSSALLIEDLEAIITRNIKDYKNSDIAVFTPLNYLQIKKASQ